ncbi:RNA exonuclease 5 [Aricia agestis]|uniref:RNA exonuclease 5 n=1 Tax=Aricia agestis TaxID=91739 RepID=UPI001C2017D1|nr:RNA exonuclease 5 [Aricia agestis]
MSKDKHNHEVSPKRRRLNTKDVSASKESIPEVKSENINRKINPKHNPKFRLKTVGENASLNTDTEARVPLTLTDIQHLLLHSLLGNLNVSQAPRWYVLDKCNHISQTTCLILEGVSVNDWLTGKENASNIDKIFEDVVEVITPSLYNGSLVRELALVPLSETEKESIIHKYGSMNLALEARKDLMIMMRAVFPIADSNSCPLEFDSKEKFPRTQLILSAWQLIQENYPVPLKGKLKTIYSDYVFSKDQYAPVTSKSPMFGLDCEMCVTSAGSELTRISIVNEKYETIYESYVKPYNNIVDYVTRFSGITKSILDDVTKRLEDVQKDLKELLPPDAILVGQSLNSDLHALKMMHPYVIDTSLIYNFTGERTRKPKLKVLAREFLNQDIQSNKNGHCSVEDSIAALKLVQLKLTKSIQFGDAVHTNRQGYKDNVVKMLTKKEYALSIFNHIIEEKKTSLVVGCDDITGDYHTFLMQAKESFTMQLKKVKPKKVKLNTCDGVEEVIATAAEATNNYNLVMAHLKVNMDDKLPQLSSIDGWIKSIWDSLPKSALFVVIFSGTTTDNGIAMAKVKNTL